MHAYSLYQSSPNSNLDQTSGIESMSAMQEFLNRYPASSFRDRAVEVIDASQQKLEVKGFNNARQYYKMKMYNAAVVALDNFRQNFPDSRYVEEAWYLSILSEFNLAEQSIRSKQAERYASVVEHYKEFLDRYPESKFLRDAEKLYGESLEKVSSLKHTNS
jgi:outer membrane protein assembly factor BamD